MTKLLPRRVSRRRTVLIASLLVAVGFARSAEGQLKGHYIPGFTGLGNGTQPPPGLSLAVPLYFYPTDTLKDADGHTLPAQPQINVSFIGAGLVWVTNCQLLGANLGGSITPLAFMKSRIETNSLEVPGDFHFTDIYFQPFQLGWHWKRADLTVGWGFFAPTGEFEVGGNNNSGLGMFSNDFQAGTTIRLDDKRQWSTSLLGTFEVHSHKKSSEITVGDILTLEGGTGRAFYSKVEGTPIPQIVNVGVAYYAQWKVTPDTVSGQAPPFAQKDRVFGVGVEGNIYLPKTGLLLDLRVVPEFGARLRTQGITFMLTAAYTLESLVEHP